MHHFAAHYLNHKVCFPYLRHIRSPAATVDLLQTEQLRKKETHIERKELLHKAEVVLCLRWLGAQTVFR